VFQVPLHNGISCSPEGENSSFQNVVCIQCGAGVFKTMQKVFYLLVMCSSYHVYTEIKKNYLV
jgi:hypothetical protein